MKYEFLNYFFRFLQKLKMQINGFKETKGEVVTCLIYVHLVIKTFRWSKHETAWTSNLLYTKPLEKCVSYTLNWNYWSYIFNNKGCSVTIQRALSRRHTTKESDDSKEDPINVDRPWGSFTKTILRISFKWRCFFPIRSDFLGQVYLMRNCFFTVNTSAEQLLLQSN